MGVDGRAVSSRVQGLGSPRVPLGEVADPLSREPGRKFSPLFSSVLTERASHRTLQSGLAAPALQCGDCSGHAVPQENEV